MPTLARPTSDVVLKAYLGALVPELVGGARISSALPVDRSTWKDSGFVVATVVGGTPNPEILQRRPVFSLQCTANNGDSSKAPWARANVLAEAIRALSERRDRGLERTSVVAGPAEYGGFVVTNFLVLTEPQRLRGDPSAYARFVFDVELWWSPTGTGL